MRNQVLKVLLLIAGIFIMLFGKAQQKQVEVLSFSELQKKYQQKNDTTYIVNFWATWCRPCVKELPYFKKIHKKYENEKVKIILVSMDFQSHIENKLIPFIQKRNIKSEVVLVPQKGANEWINKVSERWSGAIPATLIINKNRKIRQFYAKPFKFGELDSIVNKIIQL